MKKYYLKFSEEEIKYIKVKNHIKNLIDRNKIEDGEKLPTIRDLSVFLEVNKITVINAYKKLKEEGYATQRMGSGTYAKKKDGEKLFKREYSKTLKEYASNEFKNFIDFTGEITDSSFFPIKDLKEVLNEVLDRDGAKALIYQEVLGYEKLRKEINLNFWNGRLKEDNILIVSGAQQGIDIASKALINVNDGVIIEKPTYSGALSVFKCRRANVFEVCMESDGINLKKFESILKKHKIKCFYAMSYFQNPTGISYSLEKKKRILELSLEYDFYIIEDDYLSELIYSDDIKYKTFKELDRWDRVIYIKSFSKIFLPGIRIGYVIPPKKFIEAFQNSKVNTDISTSSLMQRALERYIYKGFWENHIRFLNKEYYIRYKYMKECLEKYLGKFISFNDPKGGLIFFLRINDNININSKKLFYILREKNMLITPGLMFFKTPRCGEKYFRLSFSKASLLEIEEGIKKIHDVFLERIE